MVRFFSLTLSCILFGFSANAQQLYQQWSNKFSNSAQFRRPSNNNFEAGNVVIDENGNSYVDFSDNGNTAIEKFNNLGQVVWRVDSLPYISYPNMDIYSQNALTYQNGYLYLVSNDGIQKFDLNGNVVWFWNNNSLLNNGSRPDPWLWVDSSDNGIIGWASGDQMNIAKISNGIVVWQNYYPTSHSALSDFVMRIDNSGNAYLSYTGNWVIIDGNNLASIINKFDISGNILWTAHSFAGTGDNAPQIEIQSNGDVWAFANDSLKVYAGATGALTSDRGRYPLYAPIYHNDSYHYYAYGVFPYYVAETDNNANLLNTFNGPAAIQYLQGFYSNGHLYIVAANGPTDVVELDTNLEVTNHIVVQYQNGNGDVWSTGGIDSMGNFYLFSTDWSDSADIYKFCLGCLPNMRGRLYVDSNLNCSMDSFETGVENNIVSITPGPYYAVTDRQGNFSSLLPPATYTVTPLRKMYWNASCGDSAVFILNPSDSLVQVPDMGICPENNVCDDGLSIWTTDANPGYYQNVYVSYENVGTDIDSGIVEVKMDGNFIYQNAIPPPDSIAGFRLFWFYDSLKQNEVRSIVITDSVPTWVQQFSFYEFTAQIIPFGNDTNPGNNYDEVINEVFSSFDPNEKVCTVKRGNAWGYVEDSSLLVYKIIFQNTGSDTARQIVVVDTLSNNLDISSLTLLATSIPGCQIEIFNNNIINFVFKPAMLPDSAVNNAGSQGFVSFAIKPMPDLYFGQVITNTATIYFDFNAGVHTNTTINYYHSMPTDVQEISDDTRGIKIYPNPVNNKLTVSFAKPSGHACEIFVYDISGRSIADLKFGSDYNISFNTEQLANGAYFISIKEDELVLAAVKFIKL